MNNVNLHVAKAAKNDEFYTQLTDIENELRHYSKHFKGKTVLCNCDDPFESNFFKYFVLNFNKLKLKKLITTCYAGSDVAEYRNGKAKPYKAVVTTVYDTIEDGDVDMEDVCNLFDLDENELTELEGDGDFRSEECLKLLDEADIVVTNPPFSLFREYVAVLMEHKKKFIIIGSKNAITYKEFFPLLKNNKMWLGSNNPAPKEFMQRDGTIKKFGNIGWYTNLDLKKCHEELTLVNRYTPDEYPHYDNYDAIEVNKVANIPYDYDGVMGVPITFLDKYNPEQFEIIGLTQRGCHDEALETKKYDDYWEMRQDGTRTGSSGSKTNGNPNLAMNDGKNNYFINSDGYIVQSRYQRILIRNKHTELPKKS